MKKKIIAVFSVFIAIILVLVVIVYNNSYKNDAIDENDRPFWNLEFSQ